MNNELLPAYGGTNYAKTSQIKPKQTQSCPPMAGLSAAPFGGNLSNLSAALFGGNSHEFLIDFNSNKLWHKSLKQKPPLQFKHHSSNLAYYSALFREHFESDSRQFESNSRQLALWLTPQLNPPQIFPYFFVFFKSDMRRN